MQTAPRQVRETSLPRRRASWSADAAPRQEPHATARDKVDARRRSESRSERSALRRRHRVRSNAPAVPRPRSSVVSTVSEPAGRHRGRPPARRGWTATPRPRGRPRAPSATRATPTRRYDAFGPVFRRPRRTERLAAETRARGGTTAWRRISFPISTRHASLRPPRVRLLTIRKPLVVFPADRLGAAADRRQGEASPTSRWSSASPGARRAHQTKPEPFQRRRAPRRRARRDERRSRRDGDDAVHDGVSRCFRGRKKKER